MVGAASERRGGGESPLLVLQTVLGGTDAGGDELDWFGKAFANQLDFMGRADQTRHARQHRQPRETQHLFRRRPVVTDLAQRAVVQAGQHRHGKNLSPAALGRFLRRLHHFQATTGVDGHVANIEHACGSHGMGHGLRNIVPFQVEENIDALGAQRLDEVRSLAGEELAAHLEEAQMGLEKFHERERIGAAVHIKGKNQFVGHRRRGITHAVKQAAPAKINLYLHIVGRRADGFHDLDMLMVPITLGDMLDIELIPEGIAFTCSDASLSDAQDNLATRAARLFLEEFQLKTGVRIHLEKSVPVGAGLGGGSSDAASVLLALRQLTRTKCDDAKLAELASRLGSDIPFFIYGKPAICRGRGELIEPVQLKGAYQGLLVHPGFGVSTPWAYKTYAQNPQPGAPGRTFDDFTLRNDLEPPAFSKYPWLPVTKNWFREQPEVLDALMSGSGSSVFALTVREADSLALQKRFHAEFGPALFSTPFQVTN